MVNPTVCHIWELQAVFAQPSATGVLFDILKNAGIRMGAETSSSEGFRIMEGIGSEYRL